MENEQSSKWKYLFILLLIFLLATAYRVYNDINQHDQMLENDIHKLIDEMENIVESSFNHLTVQFAGIRDIYANNKILRDTLAQKERITLYNLVKRDYMNLQSRNPDLFVMHWIDNDNKTILRMHKPHSFNDDLTQIRPIVALANQKKEDLQAFEVGKNGITYRITLPVYSQELNQHYGILEFGIKPNYFTRHIQEHFDIKAEVLVLTKSLQYITYKLDLQQINEYSILSKDSFFSQLIYDGVLKKKNGVYKLFQKDGRTYILTDRLLLPGVNGDNLAKIIIAKDISDFIEENNESFVRSTIINTLILLTGLFFVYFVFNRYEKSLTKHFTKLQKTVESLNKSENRHILAQKIAKVGNWEIDHITDRLYWSDEIYNIFDLNPKEFKPSYENFLKAIHPEDVDLVQNTFEDSIAKSEEYFIIHRVVTKSGELKYVTENGIHIFNSAGKILKTEGTVQDITKVRLLEDQAYKDALTGLDNRRLIDITLNKLIKSTKRRNDTLCIALCDIDFFKNVNDTYGHDVGDEVLISLSNLMPTSFRKSDYVGRWGGEEFIVLLPGSTLDNARTLVEQLRKKVEKYSITLKNGTAINITISVGVTALTSISDMNKDDLVKNVDNALYEAKRNGRNKVVVFEKNEVE